MLTNYSSSELNIGDVGVSKDYVVAAAGHRVTHDAVLDDRYFSYASRRRLRTFHETSHQPKVTRVRTH